MLDQCSCQGPTKKRTCVSGTLDDIDDFNGVEFQCPGDHVHEASAGRDAAGAFLTARLARYPSLLCRALAERILRSCKRMLLDGTGPGGWQRAGLPAPRISSWGARCANTVGGDSCATVILNEDVPRGRRVVLGQQQMAMYMHVDDGVFLSGGAMAELNGRMMNQCADDLETLGFRVPDRQDDSVLEKVVGYEIQRRPAAFRVPALKAVHLRAALLWTTRRRRVHVPTLARLVGIWVWGALLRRELLAICEAIFRFLEVFDGDTAVWWASARREVRLMAEAVAFMVADVGAPLANTVVATDAMGANHTDCGGFGVVAAVTAPDVVKAAYEFGLTPGFTVAKLDGDISGLLRPGKELRRRVPFSRLPAVLLDPARTSWEAVVWGRWLYEDHITLGEGRASLRVIEAMAKCPRAHRHVVLSLQDNQPWAGASAKGRSPAHAVNHLLRRRAALVLAAQLQVLLPWVQSAVMPADWLSRLINYEP